MAIQASETCKVWCFLNSSMCYSDCSGILGDNLLISLSFLLDRTLWFRFQFFLPPFLHNPSPFFIVLFWSPGELLIPLFCPLGTRACFVSISQKVQFSLFFILFFLLVLFLRKSMADYLFRSALMSRSSRFSFWPSFFFIFFLKWAESHSTGLKGPLLLLPFIPLHSGSPRYRPLALWEVTPGFLLFLLDLWYLKRTYPSSVSCVLLAFPLSCLNPLSSVLHF